MSDDTHEQELVRSRIRYLVAEQRGAMAETTRNLLDELQIHLSPSRINTVRSAIGWHAQRQTADARLKRLDLVLDRLYEKAESQPKEQRLYLQLHRLIWAQPTPTWLARERKHGPELAEPVWSSLPDRLEVSGTAQAVWATEAIAHIAAALLGSVASSFQTQKLHEYVHVASEGSAP